MKNGGLLYLPVVRDQWQNKIEKSEKNDTDENENSAGDVCKHWLRVNRRKQSCVPWLGRLPLVRGWPEARSIYRSCCYLWNKSGTSGFLSRLSEMQKCVPWNLEKGNLRKWKTAWSFISSKFVYGRTATICFFWGGRVVITRGVRLLISSSTYLKKIAVSGRCIGSVSVSPKHIFCVFSHTFPLPKRLKQIYRKPYSAAEWVVSPFLFLTMVWKAVTIMLLIYVRTMKATKCSVWVLRYLLQMSLHEA